MKINEEVRALLQSFLDTARKTKLVATKELVGVVLVLTKIILEDKDE